jgi:hypothetical protein
MRLLTHLVAISSLALLFTPNSIASDQIFKTVMPPIIESPVQDNEIVLAASDGDLADCITVCTKIYSSCSSNDTVNVPECTKKRNECIDQCKAAPEGPPPH